MVLHVLDRLVVLFLLWRLYDRPGEISCKLQAVQHIQLCIIYQPSKAYIQSFNLCHDIYRVSAGIILQVFYRYYYRYYFSKPFIISRPVTSITIVIH